MIWSMILTGCYTDSEPVYDVCDIPLTVVSTDVTPGSTLTVNATPLTDLRDTSVRVDGTPALVTAVERTDVECALCASCRSTNDCGACATCSECLDVCAECEESFTVTVPLNVPAGAVELSLSNAYGAGTTELLILLSPPIPTDTATDPCSRVNGAGLSTTLCGIERPRRNWSL